MKTANFAKVISSLVLLMSFASTIYSQQLAFPTAEGYGKYTVGGRGGKVYEITTLRSSGPGSLGEAIAASEPRTVVFRVAGTITGNFRIRNDKITIAGQTAPGDGICIKGSLNIRADNVIIRYIRVRFDPSTGESDAIFSRYNKNTMIDHVSASWSTDEVFSVYMNENVTIQWCMITEACPKGDTDSHRFGGIWGNNYCTMHHNLIAHNASRNPRWASGCGYNDYRNNVIYNWDYQSSYGGEKSQTDSDFGFTTINMVANYYKAGPATNDNVKRRIAEPSSRSSDDKGSWYVADNYVAGYPAVTADNWQGVDGSKSIKLNAPWDAMPINQQTPQDAYQAVLAHAGCSLPNRDAVDARIIEEVRTGTATYGNNGIITTPSGVGGWPELKSAPAPADADHDGMPDAWEKKRGLNPDDPSDGAKDRDRDGYTNVEEYINGLVKSDALQTPAHSSSKKAIVLEEYVFLKSPTRDCHSSTLLELTNGDLLCTWFGGTRENHPDVNIWLARKPKDGRWQVPVSVADGGGKTCFNPVLVQLKGGDIQIYYCSPNIDTGQVITSSDNGHTWSKPKRLPKGFVGPIVNKPVYMNDGTIIAGSSLQGEPGKRIHVERSTDNGKTWTKIGPISDPTNTKYEIIQPTILVHSQQRLQILARTNEKHKNAKLAQTWSQDGGLTWSPVTDATLPNNNSAIDAVTLDDGRHLLVYNHSTREDPVGGRKGRGILTVAVTQDGMNWEAAAVLEYRTGSVQYSYPSVIQTRDGLVHVSYSWHRKRIKHVVIDPKKLETYPIVDGQWPKDKIP